MIGRQNAGAVAAVDSGLLDMLHDSGDNHLVAVADGIDIVLEGVLEKLVDQHRMLRGSLHRRRHVVVERFLVVDDRHRPAAEDIGGTDEDGVADFGRDRARLLQANAPCRSAAAGYPRSAQQIARSVCGPPPGRCFPVRCR